MTQLRRGHIESRFKFAFTCYTYLATFWAANAPLPYHTTTKTIIIITMAVIEFFCKSLRYSVAPWALYLCFFISIA